MHSHPTPDDGIPAFDPVNRMIDSLLSFETPAARWLRLNGPAINRAYAEMIADPEPPHA